MRAVADWVWAYVKAWNSNDPADIEALFTEDASYFTAPYAKPQRGRAKIVKWWLANRDAPGTTSFEWKTVSVSAGVAIVQGVATYPDRKYHNLWVIRRDRSGRCAEFTEWYMEPPKR